MEGREWGVCYSSVINIHVIGVPEEKREEAKESIWISNSWKISIFGEKYNYTFSRSSKTQTEETKHANGHQVKLVKTSEDNSKAPEEKDKGWQHTSGQKLQAQRQRGYICALLKGAGRGWGGGLQPRGLLTIKNIFQKWKQKNSFQNNKIKENLSPVDLPLGNIKGSYWAAEK